MPDEWKLDKQN